jgi:hypothetical protein
VVLQDVFGTGIYVRKFQNAWIENIQMTNVGGIEDQYGFGDGIYFEYAYGQESPYKSKVYVNNVNINGRTFTDGTINYLSRVGICFEFGLKGNFVLSNLNIENCSRALHFEGLTSSGDVFVSINNVVARNCTYGVFKQTLMKNINVINFSMVEKSTRPFALDVTSGFICEATPASNNQPFGTAYFENIYVELTDSNHICKLNQSENATFKGLTIIQKGNYRMDISGSVSYLSFENIRIQKTNASFTEAGLSLDNTLENIARKYVVFDKVLCYADGDTTTLFNSTANIAIIVKGYEVEVKNALAIFTSISFSSTSERKVIVKDSIIKGIQGLRFVGCSRAYLEKVQFLQSSYNVSNLFYLYQSNVYCGDECEVIVLSNPHDYSTVSARYNISKTVSGNTLPTPSEKEAGRMVRITGGSGAADSLYICMKKADNTYGWFKMY